MITASERDQRVILTKDVRVRVPQRGHLDAWVHFDCCCGLQLLAKAGHAVAYLVGQGPVEEQFAEVKAHFQLTCDIAHAFSRCARCNCNVCDGLSVIAWT
jgi:Mut7-C RNAse domain